MEEKVATLSAGHPSYVVRLCGAANASNHDHDQSFVLLKLSEDNF